MEIIRQVIAYKRYFLDFYEAQTDDVQRRLSGQIGRASCRERV